MYIVEKKVLLDVSMFIRHCQCANDWVNIASTLKEQFIHPITIEELHFGQSLFLLKYFNESCFPGLKCNAERGVFKMLS